jgi:hypothetical protein
VQRLDLESSDTRTTGKTVSGPLARQDWSAPASTESPAAITIVSAEFAVINEEQPDEAFGDARIHNLTLWCGQSWAAAEATARDAVAKAFEPSQVGLGATAAAPASPAGVPTPSDSSDSSIRAFLIGTLVAACLGKALLSARACALWL